MKGWDSVIERIAQEECIVMSVLIPRRPVLLFLFKKPFVGPQGFSSPLEPRLCYDFQQMLITFCNIGYFAFLTDSSLVLVCH